MEINPEGTVFAHNVLGIFLSVLTSVIGGASWAECIEAWGRLRLHPARAGRLALDLVIAAATFACLFVPWASTIIVAMASMALIASERLRSRLIPGYLPIGSAVLAVGMLGWTAASAAVYGFQSHVGAWGRPSANFSALLAGCVVAAAGIGAGYAVAALQAHFRAACEVPRRGE